MGKAKVSPGTVVKNVLWGAAMILMIGLGLWIALNPTDK